jgi:hypothetical protein
VPARRTPVSGESHRIHVHPASNDEPRDDRVRIPHLASLKLVTSPDRCRHRSYSVENSLGRAYILCEVLRALDRLADVGKDPVAPASDLVPEELEPACGARSDGSLSDHASVGGKVLPYRPLLDDVSAHRYTHDECRVVEIAAITMINPRGNCLKDAPVQPHTMAACPEWEPIEVDAEFRLTMAARIRQPPTDSAALPPGTPAMRGGPAGMSWPEPLRRRRERRWRTSARGPRSPFRPSSAFCASR